MVISALKTIITKNASFGNRAFLRNLLKEELQVYILNFIYTSKYKDLIFTGGTALRKFYNLPRLSEDLDFDSETTELNFSQLQTDLANYFLKDLQYQDLEIKLKNQTLFLRFPVLKEIGFSDSNDTNILFVRLDFSFNKTQDAATNLRLFSGYDFSFLARVYDFPTLFKNKVTAFLFRTYKKGQSQTESFKGRDAFDLVWMLETGTKTGLKLDVSPQLKKDLLQKATKLTAPDLLNDLSPFFQDPTFIRNFCDHYASLLESALASYGNS